MNVVVVTDIPSPYQVEFFNAISNVNGWDITVIYIRQVANDRSWAPSLILHDHCFLSDTDISKAGSIIANATVVVFNGYRPLQVGRLISVRNRSGKPWAFWGERPGYRFPGRFGRIYRAWALRDLRFSRAPVWGIGEWAIDGYRSELGEKRKFFNVPYCYDLGRFFSINRSFHGGNGCRFLFSGSFTARKGVDLVVSAFGRLVSERYDVELHLIGTGPLQEVLRASSSSFSCRVHMHGFKQWGDLAKSYAMGDILVAPSRYDGWGLVVSEGLAAGMPVISTYNTGAARELINRKNGWMVAPGNEEDLFLAMKSAAALELNCQIEMSNHARKAARNQDIGPGVKRFMHAAEMTLATWNADARA